MPCPAFSPSPLSLDEIRRRRQRGAGL